jgi:hypothetical protein
MKTAKYGNLFRCDWIGITAIGKTRKEARDTMIKMVRQFKK